MRAVKNQSYVTLLFAILFLGAQLSLALDSPSLDFPGADISDSSDRGPFLQARILDSRSLTCSNTFCRGTGSLIGQSFMEYQITFSSRSKIEIEIDVGKPRYELQMVLSSSNYVKTDIDIFPGSLSITYTTSTSWTRSQTIESSSFSLRTLTITIENLAYTQTITTFRVTKVSETEEDDSFSFGISSNWVGPVAGAVGAVIVIAVLVSVCICVRRARLRRRAFRQQSRAAYRASEQNQAQPQPPAQQPAQFPPQYQEQYQAQYQPQYQGQLQAPIMYQPINAHSPQNYQFQPAIQFIQVPAQDYQYPNYQGYQLAPMQIVMPVDPNEGPLSEMNFDHRFPEAPLENFATSFPQKTCSICLEDLKVNQNCRQLYCEHIFHGDCAKVWLLNQMTKQNHGFCPNCNKNMTSVVERAKS